MKILGVLSAVFLASTLHAQNEPVQATAASRLRIPGSVAEGMLCGSSAHSGKTRKADSIRRNTFCGPIPVPLYPPEAKKQGIQGAVHLRAVIGKDGTIKDLRVIDGHPMLTGTAMDAVKDWRYKPYRVKGKPVEIETTITVNYVLDKG